MKSTSTTLVKVTAIAVLGLPLASCGSDGFSIPGVTTSWSATAGGKEYSGGSGKSDEDRTAEPTEAPEPESTTSDSAASGKSNAEQTGKSGTKNGGAGDARQVQDRRSHKVDEKIFTGLHPAYFVHKSTGTECVLSQNSVYCTNEGLKSAKLNVSVEEACPEYDPKASHITDFVLAEEQFWLSCSTGEEIYDFYLNANDTWNKLDHWATSDERLEGTFKEGAWKTDGPPELLPNTKILTKNFKCVSLVDELTCYRDGHNTAFTIVPDNLSWNRNPDSYPHPRDIFEVEYK